MPQILDLNDFKNIVISGKKLGVKRISIAGGEPTLYFKWVEDLVELCHNENLMVYLTTNATNKKIIKLAEKYPNLEFRISLDCYSRNKYRYFRGIDAFENVIKTIQHLSKLDNEIHINRVITSMKDEWEEFNKMIDMIIQKNLNKKENLFLRLVPCYPNKFSRKLEVIDYIKYLSKYIPALKTQLHQKNLQFMYEFTYKDVKVIIRTRGVYSPKCCPVNKRRCIEGIAYIRINPNGLIQPCFGEFLESINHKDDIETIKQKLSHARNFLDNLYVDNYNRKKLYKYVGL